MGRLFGLVQPPKCDERILLGQSTAEQYMQGAGQAAPTPRSAHHLRGSTSGGLQTSR